MDDDDDIEGYQTVVCRRGAKVAPAAKTNDFTTNTTFPVPFTIHRLTAATFPRDEKKMDDNGPRRNGVDYLIGVSFISISRLWLVGPVSKKKIVVTISNLFCVVFGPLPAPMAKPNLPKFQNFCYWSVLVGRAGK